MPARRSLLSFILVFLSLTLTLSHASAQTPRIRTIVIDPGHGGSDPGAVRNGYKEKTIVLDISKTLGDLIRKNHPEVKVIYTREKDESITLKNRSKIAYSNQADLFLSIHIDAVKSTAANGYSIYMLDPTQPSSPDKKNLYNSMSSVSARENSVITLEDDYERVYFSSSDPINEILNSNMVDEFLRTSLTIASSINEAMKKGPVKKSKGVLQGRLEVLWHSARPALLLELGYLSNESDRAILIKKDKQDAIARCIYNGLLPYLGNTSAQENALANSTQASTASSAEPTTEISSELSETQVDEFYGTQVFVLSKRLPSNAAEFKGFKPTVVERNGKYEYFLGVSENLDKARAEHAKIKKSFPSSYLVQVRGKEKTVIK